MQTQNYLGELAWQIMVFVLLGLSAGLAVWLARHYRRWLARRLAPLPKWAGLSSWGFGLLAFVVLAVVFGFFLDQSNGM